MSVDCIFCKIINKEIPANKVYEDDSVFAFRDIHPQSKTHILVVPKTHVSNLEEISSQSLYNQIFSAIKLIAKQEGIDKTGYRVCINNGPDAGQTVFHTHFHILGGEKLSDKMV